MATVTIHEGDLVTKDPSDIRVFVVDWDTANLAPGVTITTSSWTITAISPSTTDTALTKDQESIQAATSRKTQVRLSAGTLGQIYEVANKIVTNETPSQTKERSFQILIEQR